MNEGSEKKEKDGDGEGKKEKKVSRNNGRLSRKVNRGRSDRAKGEEEQQGEQLRLGEERKEEGGRKEAEETSKAQRQKMIKVNERRERERESEKEISSTWPKQIYIERDLARLAYQRRPAQEEERVERGGRLGPAQMRAWSDAEVWRRVGVGGGGQV